MRIFRWRFAWVLSACFLTLTVLTMLAQEQPKSSPESRDPRLAALNDNELLRLVEREHILPEALDVSKRTFADLGRVQIVRELSRRRSSPLTCRLIEMYLRLEKGDPATVSPDTQIFAGTVSYHQSPILRLIRLIRLQATPEALDFMMILSHRSSPLVVNSTLRDLAVHISVHDEKRVTEQIETYKTLLAHESPLIRHGAAILLSSLASRADEALAAVQARLAIESHENVRSTLEFAIRDLEAAIATAKRIQDLSSKDVEVRRQAVDKLMQGGVHFGMMTWRVFSEKATEALKVAIEEEGQADLRAKMEKRLADLEANRKAADDALDGP